MLITPNNKSIYDEKNIIGIDGPYTNIDVGYPLVSSVYILLLYKNHKITLGYDNVRQAKEDIDYIEKEML